MAHHKYSPSTLVLAVDELKEGNISLHQAAINMTSLQFLKNKKMKRCEKELTEKLSVSVRELNMNKKLQNENTRELKKKLARGCGSKGRGKSRVSTRLQTRSTQPAMALTSNSTNGSDNESDDCVLCPNCGESYET